MLEMTLLIKFRFPKINPPNNFKFPRISSNLRLGRAYDLLGFTMEFFGEINNLRWISLVNVTEAKLALNIRIVGAVDLSADILATAYNIHFNNYAAYCIIDETYNKPTEDNAGLFCTFTQSNYLDFLQLDTSTSGFIAELKHYAFYCLNHIIHVAAFEEPVIVKG